jgi:hypothetical protein
MIYSISKANKEGREMSKTRTKFSVCVGKKDGYDVYRVVWAYKSHFYIKWNGEWINVDREMNNHEYYHTELLK